MKHNVSKYSTPAAKKQSAERKASRRRSSHNGATAVVSDMDDIANYTAHQQEIARQVEEDGDCLWA